MGLCLEQLRLFFFAQLEDALLLKTYREGDCFREDEHLEEEGLPEEEVVELEAHQAEL